MKHNSSAAVNDTDVLAEIPSAIIRTLIYFDIFQHPLTRDEIHFHLQYVAADSCETDEFLTTLLMRGLIETTDGFFFLPGQSAIVGIRKERNKRCEQMMQRAKRNAEIISGFPFVRGVAFSGSISKGTMDADGDVDFFIITEPRRLWLCRSLLVLYKKIFRFNSRKYFCVNYFIDTQHMVIPDNNLFVATEVASLKPVSGEIFQSFFLTNDWVHFYYPNQHPERHTPPPVRNGFFKRSFEKLFSGRFGEWLDERFFRITLRRWEKKFPHVKREQFDLNFRSRKHVSKHHPQGFQWKVKKAMDEKTEAFARKYDLRISVPDWEQQG